MYPIEDHSNRVEFNPDSGEEIPKDLPSEKGPRVRMTIHVDAYQAHDLVTIRSITGIVVILNNTPIRWIFNHQKLVRHQLMDQDWCLQVLLINSLLKLSTCFGHWE
jgi:hypothetical protein